MEEVVDYDILTKHKAEEPPDIKFEHYSDIKLETKDYDFGDTDDESTSCKTDFTQRDGTSNSVTVPNETKGYKCCIWCKAVIFSKKVLTQTLFGITGLLKRWVKNCISKGTCSEEAKTQ